MPKREGPSSRIDLLQGTLDLLILQTLQWGPQHGHGIGLAIRASSNDALQIEHGSIYPALYGRKSRLACLGMENVGSEPPGEVLQVNSHRKEADAHGAVEMETTRTRHRADGQTDRGLSHVRTHFLEAIAKTGN